MIDFDFRDEETYVSQITLLDSESGSTPTILVVYQNGSSELIRTQATGTNTGVTVQRIAARMSPSFLSNSLRVEPLLTFNIPSAHRLRNASLLPCHCSNLAGEIISTMDYWKVTVSKSLLQSA